MIDKTLPIKLTRIANYQGTIYYPREYQPSELPEALLVEGLVTQGESLPPGIVAPSQAFIKQEIDVTVQAESIAPNKFPGNPAVVVTDKQKIEINKANADLISTLPGVTNSNALKIIEEREKAPFRDVVDLNKRVVLTKSKWENLQDRLIFDA
jgi:hypothetical protein